MDRNFAYGMEDKGYAKLEHFNHHFLHLQELTRMPKNTPSGDASGITTDGTEINIEIKVRNQTLIDKSTLSGLTSQDKPYTASTIYIEAHKAGDMFLDYFSLGREPIYVNFLDNDYVVVYNLGKLKTRPKRVQKKIWSKLYQNWENQIREELPLNEAFIYKWDGNNYILITKPNK